MVLREWPSFREYAEELADDIELLDGVPEAITRYFDWDGWVYDLRFDYRTEQVPNGGLYVFRAS